MAHHERALLVEKNLYELLNHTDVKNLPCYKVLLGRYGIPPVVATSIASACPIPSASPIALPSPKLLKCDICGVLYKLWEKHILSEKHLKMIQIQTPEPEEQPETPEPEEGHEATDQHEATEPGEISVDSVFSVEIKGVRYLNHGKNLYDQGKKYVGYIDHKSFVLPADRIEISSKPMQLYRIPGMPNLYHDKGGNAYMRLPDVPIARAIGTYTNETLSIFD